jgi:hypothetical protein
MASPTTAQSDVEGTFRLQWLARCETNTGEPVASGDITVRIYDASTDGTEVYNSGSDFAGSISDGRANLCLGCLTALNLDLAQLYYLEFDVAGEEVIGDANGGRLAFYPGAGEHAGDLSSRVDDLESLLGLSASSPGSRPNETVASSPEAPQLSMGHLGLGMIAGETANYRTAGNLLHLPNGLYATLNYWLFLGPYYYWVPEDDGCCVGRVGDANGSGDNEPTIGDVSVMIDALFIGNDWSVISCLTEADVNQSGGSDPQGGPTGDITIGDVSYLIDYLFITGMSLGLPDCL